MVNATRSARKSTDASHAKDEDSVNNAFSDPHTEHVAKCQEGSKTDACEGETAGEVIVEEEMLEEIVEEEELVEEEVVEVEEVVEEVEEEEIVHEQEELLEEVVGKEVKEEEIMHEQEVLLEKVVEQVVEEEEIMDEEEELLEEVVEQVVEEEEVMDEEDELLEEVVEEVVEEVEIMDEEDELLEEVVEEVVEEEEIMDEEDELSGKVGKEEVKEEESTHVEEELEEEFTDEEEELEEEFADEEFGDEETVNEGHKLSEKVVEEEVVEEELTYVEEELEEEVSDDEVEEVEITNEKQKLFENFVEEEVEEDGITDEEEELEEEFTEEEVKEEEILTAKQKVLERVVEEEIEEEEITEEDIEEEEITDEEVEDKEIASKETKVDKKFINKTTGEAKITNEEGELDEELTEEAVEEATITDKQEKLEKRSKKDEFTTQQIQFAWNDEIAHWRYKADELEVLCASEDTWNNKETPREPCVEGASEGDGYDEEEEEVDEVDEEDEEDEQEEEENSEERAVRLEEERKRDRYLEWIANSLLGRHDSNVPWPIEEAKERGERDVNIKQQVAKDDIWFEKHMENGVEISVVDVENICVHEERGYESELDTVLAAFHPANFLNEGDDILDEMHEKPNDDSDDGDCEDKCKEAGSGSKRPRSVTDNREVQWSKRPIFTHVENSDPGPWWLQPKEPDEEEPPLMFDHSSEDDDDGVTLKDFMPKTWRDMGIEPLYRRTNWPSWMVRKLPHYLGVVRDTKQAQCQVCGRNINGRQVRRAKGRRVCTMDHLDESCSKYVDENDLLDDYTFAPPAALWGSADDDDDHPDSNAKCKFGENDEECATADADAGTADVQNVVGTGDTDADDEHAGPSGVKGTCDNSVEADGDNEDEKEDGEKHNGHYDDDESDIENFDAMDLDDENNFVGFFSEPDEADVVSDGESENECSDEPPLGPFDVALSHKRPRCDSAVEESRKKRRPQR